MVALLAGTALVACPHSRVLVVPLAVVSVVFYYAHSLPLPIVYYPIAVAKYQ